MADLNFLHPKRQNGHEYQRKIGQRIMDERKAKGLTRKALAELTGELKTSRINNYERRSHPWTY